MRNIFVVASTFLLLSSCGTAVSPEVIHESSQLNSNLDLGIADQLVGTYAIETYTRTSTKAFFFGSVEADNYNLNVGVISKSADGFSVSRRLCHSTFKSSSGVKVDISDKVMQMYPLNSAPLRVWSDSTGTHFAQDKNIVISGANLSDPENEDLPTKASDPRIVDGNNDGLPDFEIYIDGGFLRRGTAYFVERNISSFSGTIDSVEDFKGSFIEESTQSIVKATNPLLTLKMAPAVANNDTSYIRFVKVSDSESYDCDAIDFRKVFDPSGLIYPPL